MQDPLISVIVPVYKVEPYLRRCLDSIVNQTYKNLEIILVDDGSPDNCPQICDDYATADNRIIVIHQENQGLSAARNAGLDICKGEYISFVDSDDWIAENFVETLYNCIKNKKADIAICPYIKTSSTFTYQAKGIHFQSISLSSIEATKKLWSADGTVFVTAWGKLFSRSLWESIRFPIGEIHEDEYTSYKLLFNSQKTIFIDIPLYCYFQRPNSIMASTQPNSIRVIKAHWERFEYFNNKKQVELVNLCLKTLCWDLLFAYGQAKLNKAIPVGFTNSAEILKNYKIATKTLYFYKSKVSFSFMLHLFAIFPEIYLLYRKLFPVHIRDV